MTNDQPSQNESNSLHLKPEVGVFLPCSQEDFGAFISSLLGRPQTIRGFKPCIFDLVMDDIINTYHLVDQRVQQNAGTLINFTMRIMYDDYSSVDLNSVEDLESYREVRPLVSTDLNMNWTYLIKFPHSEHSEKQTIDITFSTTGNTPVAYRPIRPPAFCSSAILFTIEHTSRTWGADMESLLNGHIETLKKEEPKSTKFISSHSDWIGVFAGLIFILLATLGAVFAAETIAEIYITEMNETLKNSSNTVPEQINYLTEFTIRGAWARFNFLQGVYFIASLILAVLIGTWVTYVADKNSASSFLQLTDRAKNKRNESLQISNKNWWLFIASSSGTIVLGVLSRVVFYYISKWWLN